MIAIRPVRRPLLGGAVLLGAAVVALGAATPGYSHGADTISGLASPGQPHAAAGRAALVAYGLSVVAGAGAVGRHVPRRSRLLVALVRTYGWAGVVAGLAAKGLPGTAPTTAGAVHVAATLAGGGAVVLAMAVVWHGGLDAPLRRASGVLAWTVPVLAVILERCWGTGVYGYVERVLVALPVVWLAVLERPLWRCGQDRRRRSYGCRAAPAQNARDKRTRSRCRPPQNDVFIDSARPDPQPVACGTCQAP